MKSHKSKKIISKIIFILSPLFLTTNTLAMKPAKPYIHIQNETSRNQASQTELKLPAKKTTINYNHRKRLSYLNELTVKEANKSVKTDLKPAQISIKSDGCITKRYETKNYIITDILTKNGINIIKKTKKDSAPKTSTPTYGPYKNDPYNESDDEWENNKYVNKDLKLRLTNQISNFLKIKIDSNETDFDIPNKCIYYAWMISPNSKKYFKTCSTCVLSTDSLMNYLKKLENDFYKNKSFNMLIMDNCIKLSKPLDFPKNEWSKRQKNLNFIIYVKKEFLQNLTPEEWDDMIFYLPLKMLS